MSAMMAELAAWSARCDDVLADLEREMEKVRVQARKRGVREAKAERQIAAVMEAGEKDGAGLAVGGQNSRGVRRKGEDEDDGGDAMEVDNGSGSLGGGGKKRSGGGGGGMLGKIGWGGGGGGGGGKSGR